MQGPGFQVGTGHKPVVLVFCVVRPVVMVRFWFQPLPRAVAKTSQHTGEFTLSSDIEEDDWNHQQDVFLLGPAHQDKSLRSTRVPLTEKRCHDHTVIAHPLLPNHRKPPGSSTPPLLMCQKSALPKTSAEPDCASSV